MESTLVIELKTACVDTGIFCWTNPCRKIFNIDLRSPEINSEWRERRRHMKFNNLHKKDIAREIIHATRRRVPRTRCTTIEKEKLPQGDIIPSLFN